MTTIKTVQSDTHRFWIYRGYHYNAPDAFTVEFRPLNPRTGQPWQASHRVTLAADVQPPNYRVPVAYSTIEAACVALAWKMDQLGRR